ncbi:MAG TPA: alanine--tRNA ligase [Candidatus Moranbacteria bacterium]|nr:alanine--tRNA ligase [Candidatus Moranbacteria bacterium]
MTARELRQKYLDFFKEKGHAIIPSASVVPENDPTTLFITAGMHPLVPYLMGEKHPDGDKLADVQKCIRTVDIDEVGDNRHLTFFEMLGNWSLGDYFKKDAISWSFEFLTNKKWLGLDPKRIYVTVFAGDKKAGAGKDEESVGYWKAEFKKLGIDAGVCELNQKAEKKSRIFMLGMEDNFWGPAGETGPCGPCSEMFYDTRPEEGELQGTHEELVKSFRLMEIWNDVFMEFNKKKDGTYEKMARQNVDTGMGLERTVTVLSGTPTVFETDLFLPILQKIEEISGKKYDESEETKRAMRIIADHIKASVFIIADGMEPSNVQRGYVLRRLIRRAIRQGHILGINNNFTAEITKIVQEMYGDVYPEVDNNKILEVLNGEEEKFRKTLENGLKEFDKLQNFIAQEYQKNSELNYITGGELAFKLYQTYGFPLEMFFEELDSRQIIYIKNKVEESFNKELEKHQELSRTASAGMFKGGLADTLEKTTQLHTTAHLMLAGLRKVLGSHIHQKGSNINGERLRFDFSHPEKMTDEQKKAVEDFVNGAIKSNADVILEEMTVDEAKSSGAEGEFEHKYGDKVKVYTIGQYSKEICGGPHVKNTSEIKGIFKIKKEESSSAGVRRIKATVN